jgi:hypothetical protein
MKKLFSVALVCVMLLAFAAPVLAASGLFSKADGWYFDADECGVLTVKDNKKEFTYDLDAGLALIGLQRSYTGQLKLVGFVAHEKCDGCGECLVCSECVCEPEVEVPMEDKLNDAIKNGDVSGTGPFVLTVDGVDYSFVSNNGNYNGNGSLFCWIDGVQYRLERNNHGLIGVFVN